MKLYDRHLPVWYLPVFWHSCDQYPGLAPFRTKTVNLFPQWLVAVLSFAHPRTMLSTGFYCALCNHWPPKYAGQEATVKLQYLPAEYKLLFFPDLLYQMQQPCYRE